MQKEDTKFDVAVIGGGPAGIMAAIQSARNNLCVVLIEKNKQLGKKLLLTGNGRCNLTNAEFDLKNLVANYHNGEFLYYAFSPTTGGFGPKEAIKFFEDLGLKTKIENGKRVFPVSDDADDVLEALKKELEKLKVEIIFNSEVIDIKNNTLIFSRMSECFEIRAKKYILATGGKSYPQTGSNGIGYKIAEKLGHTIIKPSPALCPIRVSALGGPASGWKSLQGINLEDVKISVSCNGKKKFSEEGEVIFTHFGVSGPAILNISGKIEDLLAKGETKLSFDLFPLLNQEQLLKGLEDVLKKYPNKSIKNVLSIFVPERLAGVLLDIVKIDSKKIANNMSKIEKSTVVKILKNIETTAEDVLGFDLAYITKGGVSLKEIDHKIMKSKIIDNLFFAGEIIDVDGKTGGFNLQMCWSTGFIAGQNK